MFSSFFNLFRSKPVPAVYRPSLEEKMDELARYEAFVKELDVMVAEDDRRQKLQAAEYKRSTEKQNKAFLDKYEALKKTAHERGPKMNGPKSLEEWPSTDYREELYAMFKVINDANLWSLIKKGTWESDDFDIISRHPLVEACGHSGATESLCFSIMKVIADRGWDAYKSEYEAPSPSRRSYF